MKPKADLFSYGLDLIRKGRQMIAQAEITEEALEKAIDQAGQGDNRLLRQLNKKPGFYDLL